MLSSKSPSTDTKAVSRVINTSWLMASVFRALDVVLYVIHEHRRHQHGGGQTTPKPAQDLPGLT